MSYENPIVAKAFDEAEKLMDDGKQTQADEVEHRAQDLHDQVYVQLCEQHAEELNAEADRLREEADAEYAR